MKDPIEQAFNERRLEIIKKNLEKNQSMRRPQSTYNDKIAQEFRPFYDKAIDTLENVCIPWKEYWQLAPDTLYKQVNGGLKWLCNNGTPDEQQRYMRLRAAIRFKKSFNPDEGIWIAFGTDKSYLKSPAVPLSQPVMDRTQWKETFLKWLDEGGEEILYLKGLILSQDDKEFLEATLDARNAALEPKFRLIYTITLDSIKIYR